jgi:hypothetical protein
MLQQRTKDGSEDFKIDIQPNRVWEIHNFGFGHFSRMDLLAYVSTNSSRLPFHQKKWLFFIGISWTFRKNYFLELINFWWNTRRWRFARRLQLYGKLGEIVKLNGVLACMSPRMERGVSLAFPSMVALCYRSSTGAWSFSRRHLQKVPDQESLRDGLKLCRLCGMLSSR